MSKIEIDATRTNVRISAEGAVAMVIGIALVVAAAVCGFYFLVP